MTETERQCLIECMEYICYKLDPQVSERLFQLLNKLKQESKDE